MTMTTSLLTVAYIGAAILLWTGSTTEPSDIAFAGMPATRDSAAAE